MAAINRARRHPGVGSILPDNITATDGTLGAVIAALTVWVGKLQFRPDPRLNKVLDKLDDQNKKLSELGERISRIEGKLE